MVDESNGDLSDSEHIIAEPQTHYQEPWKQFNNAWAYFMIVVCILMIITLFLPSGPGIPFVVAYVVFAVVGGTGLIFFTLTSPAIGLMRRVHLPRISDDYDGDSASVQVWTIRPFFGMKRCEQIGGRQPNRSCQGGLINYDEEYTCYKGIFGTRMTRYRWEPALIVVGSGEATDCTDIVSRSDGVPKTRLQWLRRRKALPGPLRRC